MISIVMMIIFALGMFLFSCSKFMGMIGILLGLLNLILTSSRTPIKLPEKMTKILKPLLLLGLFSVGALSGMTTAEGGLNDYSDQIDSVMELLMDNELVKARSELEQIKEVYGTSDNTVLLETMIYLGESNFDAARNTAYYYSDRFTVEYYTLLETVFLTLNPQDHANDLRNLYMEAAYHHPYWTHMQKMAGVSYIDRQEFTKGEYHLLRAYEQDPSDYQTAYYLGVTCYEQQRMSEALEYFEEAALREPDETTSSYIAWYLNDISLGGESDEN
ncbi:MAG: tetratricopeptide repeat protein [Clostridia bacterium]|nr:tetratricopeptide repeat protein [Clostridia bacterium]